MLKSILPFCFLQHLSKTKVPSYFHSATPPFHRDPSKSIQLYQEVASGQHEDDPVGRPVSHMSALKQATGEAIYIDDIPKLQSESLLRKMCSCFKLL